MQEFYSLISGTELILENGFLDLTSLAVLAGYKFPSKNITAMGVQVIRSLLNQMVSTADDLWGLRWNMIPDALKCCALGDIKFGFVRIKLSNFKNEEMTFQRFINYSGKIRNKFVSDNVPEI